MKKENKFLDVKVDLTNEDTFKIFKDLSLNLKHEASLNLFETLILNLDPNDDLSLEQAQRALGRGHFNDFIIDLVADKVK